MQLTDMERSAVERVIRERFGAKVRKVVIESLSETDDGLVITILVEMAQNTTADDFSGRFFGLTGRVRNALGENMRGVFPIIRPVEANA